MATNWAPPSLDLGCTEHTHPIRLHSQTLAHHASISWKRKSFVSSLSFPVPSPLHSPSTIKSMNKFCLPSLASPSDSLFFISPLSQSPATVTYRTTATHPQAHFYPLKSLSVQKPSVAPLSFRSHPHPQMMTWKQDTVVWLTCLSPGLALCSRPSFA